jgi:hypothetical protein
MLNKMTLNTFVFSFDHISLLTYVSHYAMVIGEDGYIYLQTGKNMCDIEYDATYTDPVEA